MPFPKPVWETIQPVVDLILFYKHHVTSNNQTGFPKMIDFSKESSSLKSGYEVQKITIYKNILDQWKETSCSEV